MSENYIPNTVEYTHTSLPALSRCMNVIRQCTGYIIENKDVEALFSPNKELSQDGDKLQYIIHSKLCFRIRPLGSSICKICSQQINNRKQTHKKSDYKENKNPNGELSNNEIWKNSNF